MLRMHRREINTPPFPWPLASLLWALNASSHFLPRTLWVNGGLTAGRPCAVRYICYPLAKAKKRVQDIPPCLCTKIKGQEKPTMHTCVIHEPRQSNIVWSSLSVCLCVCPFQQKPPLPTARALYIIPFLLSFFGLFSLPRHSIRHPLPFFFFFLSPSLLFPLLL